jgi:RNA polymerase sigma-70 factor (ECF subfamily)
MTSATSAPTAAADDQVRVALADPKVLTELLAHARAFVGSWLKDRPIDEREELAETAVQETARWALQKSSAFNPIVGSPAAWLHGFLVNVLKQTARALRRRPAQAPTDPDDWDRITAALASTRDSEVEASDLAGILARLNVEQRTILDLRFRAGLDHAAIAARLGISEGTARVRLCRALAAARAVAGAAPGEDGP